MYNRAFLRAYCDYLGIDPGEGLARYEIETASAGEKTTKAKPKIPQVSAPSKSHTLLVWSVMLLISVAGLFFSRKWIASVFSPYFSHPSAPSIAADATPDSAPASPVKEPTTKTPLVSPPPSATTEHAGETPSSITGGTPSTSPSPPGTIRLEFEVLQECWVSLERDGTPVLVKMLEPGDNQSFNAIEKFYVILGNAGGVKLRINGKLVKPLGKSGEVVRVLINEQSIKDLVEKATG
jgi:hypothetical protein